MSTPSPPPIARLGPLSWLRAWGRAVVGLPGMRDRLAGLQRDLDERLARIEERLDVLEGELGATVRGHDGRERRQREDAILNQLTSTPVALRELATRIGELEANAASDRVS